ncbi:MAG: S8 family serine peptidase [Clostridia bacterium]|nr:S8 family serine peptidase [Clostridia bacterium]
MKKLSACLLVLFLLAAMTAAPYAAALSAAGSGCPGTDNAANLIKFSERLDAMIERCSDAVTKGAPGDPFNSARLIVKAAGEPDTTGALGFVGGWNGRWVIQYASPLAAKEAAERMDHDPSVMYAVPDTEYRMEFSASAFDQYGLDGFNSWGYGPDQIDMAALNSRVLAKYGGNVDALPEVIVAVCDSGVNVGHEFFAGRTVPGYDFVNNDADPSDGFGHGTFCAGVVADGTLPNVKIMPLKCINDDGYFATSDVVSAVEYAYLHGCAAANLSLIEYNPYVEALYEEVINAAADAGTVCCVASGNWGSDASTFVPGKVERSFTVAAHYPDHGMWPLSNTGTAVDITAPGVDILSTLNTGGYDVQSGTSFAAPHAAACCAMIKTYDPDIDPDDTVALLKAHAVDEGYSGGGAGRLYVGSLFAEDPPPVLMGDANGDGAVTVIDALTVLRFSMGLIGADALDTFAADMDGSGTVTVTDAVLILRKSMGIIG